MNVLPLINRLKRLDISIQLVGKQLKLNAPEGALTPEIISELKDRKAEIIEFLQENVQSFREYLSIEPSEKKEYYALSSAQKRLYILHQMEASNISYNQPRIFFLVGDIDLDRLDRTFRNLVPRHESLRTSFEVIEGEPVQRINEEVEFEVEYDRSLVNCQGKGKVPSPIKVEKIIRNFIRPFDLSQAPLFRVGVIKTQDQRYMLMMDIHHIISDGMSMKIFIHDFMAIYGGNQLSLLKLQYKDCAHWQNQEKEQETYLKQTAYWQEQFREEIPVLELPTDYVRPRTRDFEGTSMSVEISQKKTQRLKELALKQGTTLYTVLLAVFNVFLSKISNQEAFIVGTVAAGRQHSDLEPIIGMFVNTLAIIHHPGSQKHFNEFLKEVNQKTLEAFENQDYPFDELVEKIDVNRDASRNPLFDVMFTLQDLDIDTIQIPGLRLEPYDQTTNTSKFDLMFQAIEKEQKLFFIIEYRTKLFKETTIQRFIGYFKKITAVIIVNPGVKLGEIEIIPGSEKEQILFQFNNTASEYPKNKRIQQLFEEEVEKTPHKAALAYNYQILTYQALDLLANQLAGHFRDRGLEPEAPVGIMLETSLEMIAAVLAALKAGGAYLPIDPDYPPERINLMLMESNTQLVVTTRTCTGKGLGGIWANPGKDILYLEDFLMKTRVNSGYCLSFTLDANLAYIIYTSGSTGSPKGVMVEHRNVIRLVKNTNFIDFKAGDRILQTGALEFDASTFEIWGALLNGLTLYLSDKNEILTPGTLKKIITNNQITTIWLTSPLFNQMVQGDVGIFVGLRNLLVGGDVLSPPHINQVRKRFPRLQIINGYGPTENTTFSTTFLIDKEYKTAIPIGKPIANSTAYIVDKNERLQPIGIAGELYVGGDGISRGYLNTPELTAEKFDHDLWDYQDYQHEKKNYKLQNTNYKQITKKTTRQLALIYEKFLWGVQGGGFYKKSPPGRRRQKIYKTGDLAYWLCCGSIEFLGRVDQQVKIRGFRIEPGEIENHLLNYSQVKEAVVLVRKGEKGDKYLCAYIVCDQGLDSSELRHFLSGRLPDYMIPSYFVLLEKLPLTSNGKVDWRVLPEPGVELTAGEYLGPRDDIEKKLAQLWSDVLGLETNVISIDADFFTLGGHSLKATLLLSEIHKAFNVSIPLTEIFVNPTIKKLAFGIKEAKKSKHISIEPVELKEYYPVSSAQKRLCVLQQMDENGVGYNMPAASWLEGNLDKDRLEKSFRRLIQRHESFRTSFEMLGQELVQRIHQEVEFEIEYYDASQVKVEIEESEGTRGFAPLPIERATGSPQPATALISSFIRPFDLSRAPLLRVGLIKEEEEKYLLMVDMHHVISDGTSINVFLHDFTALYSGDTLAPLRIRYKDFSEWWNSKKQKEEIKKQEAFWIKEFEEEIQPLNLPTDYPRPAVQSFAGSSLEFKIPVEQTMALKELALDTGATLYMVILAIYNVFLSKISSQEDIVVGTPIAARRHADLQKIIGMFINTLPLRNYPGGDKSFVEFLNQVRVRSLKAFENQEYQLEDLVAQAAVQRDASRNPLFDVMFSLPNTGEQPGKMQWKQVPGLKVTLYKDENTTSKFDISLICVESGEELHFTFQYRTKLFKEETIARFITFFKKILFSVLENRDKKISEIEIISDKGKKQVFEEFSHFNHAPMEYPSKSVNELFEEQVKRNSDSIACFDDGNYLTYEFLNNRINVLAKLIKEL